MKKLEKIINKVQEAVTEAVADGKAAGAEYSCNTVKINSRCDVEVTVSVNLPTSVIIYHYDEDGTINEHQSPLLEKMIASRMPHWYDVEREYEDPRCDFEKEPSLANCWFFQK